MGGIILLVALSCPNTTLINQNKQPWNQEDYKILQSAKTRCSEIYPDAPCVKKFYKRPDENNYWVICGQKEKR